MNRIFAALALACASLFFAVSSAFAGAGSGPFTGGGDPNKLSLMVLPTIAVAITLAVVAICSAPALARRLLIVFVGMGTLALAGCTETLRGYQVSQTSAAGWGEIASGAGKVIGQTKYDTKVAKASEEFSRYCGGLRAVAMGASIFAPEKHQALARQAAAAVNSVCDNPPADVASALSAAAKAYEAVLAAGKATGITVQTAAAGA
ncbi:hypothetical protein [Bosea sp. (in: a-proteobacteria)]|uniref:hypothetical protein n=1 Tax=Bosea sp. (in: a-proteobacteria) TaxID=1871050 RepID=UPI0026323F06|nr:hypothetical protein [Bosea sp. (in: a-proteobacteria)]MCO5092076.1 hypothetical protein [Bosea sp. (in: a-proteobacteria)]